MSDVTTKAQAITAVLNRLRGALGTGEIPPNSNNNFIVKWYNENVEKIGEGPWCEMTNTWSKWTGGAKKIKKGRAFTPWAAGDAQKGVNGSSWHWGTKGMMAGDEVYYDWARGVKNANAVDHTGTVEKINDDGTFYVLEGNTGSAGGGQLLRMHRDSKYVMGFTRLDWNQLVDDVPSPAPNPTPSREPESLIIDGNLGPKTIKAWQRVMKTPVDGVISEPKSDLVVAVQRKLKATVNPRQTITGKGIKQNGEYTPTVANLQNYLNSPVTGMISKEGSQVVKALQRRLNEKRF